jgi:hypothetical protein
MHAEYARYARTPQDHVRLADGGALQELYQRVAGRQVRHELKEPRLLCEADAAQLRGERRREPVWRIGVKHAVARLRSEAGHRL